MLRRDGESSLQYFEEWNNSVSRGCDVYKEDMFQSPHTIKLAFTRNNYSRAGNATNAFEMKRLT